jgi:Tfp pilus assembly PilM family ATPase
LASKKDINSTEKLLNVIRGKHEEAIESITTIQANLPKRPSVSKINVNIHKIVKDKKNYTVGVDIGPEYIYLTKTTKSSDGRPILIDQRAINYSEQTTKSTTEFKEILKSSLTSFCGTIASCNIWTTIPAVEANVHHIKIPLVQKKQLDNAILWTAKKENPIDEKNYIFDYEIQGEVIDQGIRKYFVMVYTVPKAEIEEVKNLFTAIGMTLTGVTIAPFAIQNIFRTHWIQSGESTSASLFIGDEYSHIDIYRGDSLVLTRGIKTGTSSMMDAISESILEKTGNIRLTKEEAQKILYSLSPDSEKLNNTDVGYGLKEDEILEMIFPALERLARQIERTLEYYATTVGSEKVETLYVSTRMNYYEPIIYYLTDQLGIKSESFDPFKHQITNKAVEPISMSEKVSLVPALGLSLSDNSRTPNAIFTYTEKNKEVAVRNINRGIFASFAAAMIICISALIYQSIDYNNLSQKRSRLQQELALYNPILSTDKISTLANEVKMHRQLSRQYAQRYLAMSTIGEISALTPENIKLINMKINSSNYIAKDKTDKSTKDESDGIALEGLIYGDRNMLESYLAQYVMKLENSPMLHQVLVQKSDFSTFKKNDVLKFYLIAKTGK